MWVVCPSAAIAGSGGPPQVLISPLNGTPDASPQTQISFLGAPSSDLHDIEVEGSSSGTHAGHLKAYSTGNGASFIPNRGFQPGEHVTVDALVSDGHVSRKVSTSFTVGSIYTLPSESSGGGGSHSPVAATQAFHSRSDLRPPQISVDTQAPVSSLGDIFITPDSGGGQEGPMIVEPSGALVWFHPVPSSKEATDLRVQDFLGRPVLTWWEGQVIGGHGQGEDVIENESYQLIGTVRAGNGLYADLHEFQITPAGTAFISVYEPVHYNLSSVGGPSDGIVDDGVVQEIDIRTGLVMFEWHALGHVQLSESYADVPHIADHVYDYFHINSVQQQPDGDILVSARNTWTVYLLNSSNGYPLWRLGGKHSTFNVPASAHFAWQHDAELLPDGAISLFDNEDSPPEGSASRALRLALEPQHKTATVVSSYEHPGPNFLSPSQGNVQLLADEESFVGWGQAGYASEFSSTGQLTFDMHLAVPANSYRAYRIPWSGMPKTTPTLVASAKSGTITVYCSWNGASQVSSWRLLSGSKPSSLQPAATVARQGFETQIAIPGSHSYLQVQALDASGRVLASSSTVSS
jgi:hypothetical protein